ncbi:MAG: iron ABC transporter permease [Deltaproteobacteria bacterium]|nr:iron ABC transporter permease [Deltaproteobacteria bacterium]
MIRRTALIFMTLGGLLLAALLIGLDVGPSSITLWSPAADLKTAILWQTRLPRLLLAMLVGGGLAGAGVAYQALLHNPLADPYILGVAGGAALGSALAVACNGTWPWVLACAFLASLLTMAAIFSIARRPARYFAHSLLLTGVVCNAFAFALIMLLHTFVPIQRGQEILFLLMGTLAIAGPEVLPVAGLTIGLGSLVLFWRARALDTLALGEETACSLGIAVQRLQWEIFVAGSLMVGTVVAVSGLIGFVGLFIPHAMRLLVGHRHRLLIPAATLAGAAFLSLADTVARAALSRGTVQTELPVGVITALVGAPCFVWLLRKT